MGIPDSSITNDSFIRPAGFYVIGFTTLKFVELFIIFLGFVYIVTILFNVFIIVIICIDNRLHTPKYIAVANLGVVDLMCITSFIPSSVKTVLTTDTFMFYNGCLAQIVIYYSSMMLESFSLSVLAYDRLIAICFPLRHRSINTSTRMISILVTLWAFSISAMTFLALILNDLSFCDSLTVSNYVCEYAGVISLACNNNTLQWAAVTFVSIFTIFGPLSLIVLSYTCILGTVLRMKNVESRYKALATCTEHFILVAIFYGPVMSLYIIELFLFNADPNLKMVNLTLASCIPSCLNPIVYSLSTKEIRGRILTMLQRAKVTAGALRQKGGTGFVS